MKKLYVLACIALATLVLFSCKEKNPVDPTDPTDPTEPTTDLRVVLDKHQLELSEGEQGKLRAEISPAKEGLAISFRSENEEIATVTSSGIVTAIATGEVNIIASAEGAKSDTCVVTVLSQADLFAWADMGLFNVDESVKFGEEYMFRDTYKCQNYLGTWYIWSDGIIYTSGVGFSGAGVMAVVKTPVAIILEGDYAGAYITWELNFDHNCPSDSAGVGAEGSLTDPEEWYSYLFEEGYEGDGSFTGSALHYVDWDVDDNSLDFVGFIKDGWIGDYSNGFFYGMELTWFDLETGIYGLQLEENEEGKWQFVEPHVFSEWETDYYELMPEKEEAPAQPRRIMTLNEKQAKRLNISNTTLHKLMK